VVVVGEFRSGGKLPLVAVLGASTPPPPPQQQQQHC
jgi:hypothetical protein